MQGYPGEMQVYSGQMQNYFGSNYIASPSTIMDPSWYVDSGATNYIIDDMHNISHKSDYKGNDKLSVGNGAKLNISHIGSLLFCLIHLYS